jgi:hypothetical protein
MAIVCVSPGRSDEPPLASYFGFQPLEIYKLDFRTAGLQARDLDGDRIDDLVVVNNSRSRIDLLLSTKGPSDSQERAGANQVRSDQRMRLRTVPVNKDVISLQLGDFNGDGKPDLAYYGLPAELIILTNRGGGRFDETRRIQTGEALEQSSALAAGDMNRDGRTDLALMTANEILSILQNPDGTMGEPERMPHAATGPRFLRLSDLDGDGGDDLALLDSTREQPLRVRFSTSDGRLGPEERFDMESPRALTFADIDGKSGQEITIIEAQSGRVRSLAFDPKAEPSSAPLGRLVLFSMPRGDARGRAIELGDIDGDGKLDVIATDPANAQVILYRQGEGGLRPGRAFPSLAGARSLAAGDLDRDERAELYLLSPSEKQIARSTWDGERVGFPQPLRVVNEPLALEIADLEGDGKEELLYVSRVAGGTESFELRAMVPGEKGALTPRVWAGGVESVSVSGLSGRPPAIRVHDVNRDKRPDVIVFGEFGSPALLLGRDGNEPPAPASGSLGPLSTANPASLARELAEGSLLLATSSFARRVELDSMGQWRVVDQTSAGRGNIPIAGAALIDLVGDSKPETVLFDRQARSLIVVERNEGVDRTVGSLTIGPIDFSGFRAGDLDGDGRKDLLVTGTDKFGVLLAGRVGPRFSTVLSFESTRSDAHLGDLIAGDLNGDKQTDLALVDTAEHMVEIVTKQGAGVGELARALTFKVFDKKSFRERDSLVEPHDLTTADVDGDGRVDLILLVHDRVLIYRQDPGPNGVTTADKPGTNSSATATAVKHPQ